MMTVWQFTLQLPDGLADVPETVAPFGSVFRSNTTSATPFRWTATGSPGAPAIESWHASQPFSATAAQQVGMPLVHAAFGYRLADPDGAGPITTTTILNDVINNLFNPPPPPP